MKPNTGGVASVKQYQIVGHVFEIRLGANTIKVRPEPSISIVQAYGA
jgi:hypothetical protein